MGDQYDTSGLEALIKMLKDKRQPVARIGVLGDKSNRKPEPGEKLAPTNAEVGAAHEYGAPARRLPIRSWLRTPLITQMQTYINQSGAFKKDVLKKIIEGGSLKPWVDKLAVLGEAIVAEGFNTGGFGKWKPSEMKFKKVKQTLIESQQLRNSVTSEVVFK